jgi:hypothetical protein
VPQSTGDIVAWSPIKGTCSDTSIPQHAKPGGNITSGPPRVPKVSLGSPPNPDALDRAALKATNSAAGIRPFSAGVARQPQRQRSSSLGPARTKPAAPEVQISHRGSTAGGLKGTGQAPGKAPRSNAAPSSAALQQEIAALACRVARQKLSTSGHRSASAAPRTPDPSKAPLLPFSVRTVRPEDFTAHAWAPPQPRSDVASSGVGPATNTMRPFSRNVSASKHAAPQSLAATDLRRVSSVIVAAAVHATDCSPEPEPPPLAQSLHDLYTDWCNTVQQGHDGRPASTRSAAVKLSAVALPEGGTLLRATRSAAQRAACPDRLWLDRLGLTECCHIEVRSRLLQRSARC